MKIQSCDLCSRQLRFGEPVYPVSLDADGSVDVCVECALFLSRAGVGAWAVLGQSTRRPSTLDPSWWP
jgi:hypothetical protein